jgi:hypothetical protein
MGTAEALVLCIPNYSCRGIELLDNSGRFIGREIVDNYNFEIRK